MLVNGEGFEPPKRGFSPTFGLFPFKTAGYRPPLLCKKTCAFVFLSYRSAPIVRGKIHMLRLCRFLASEAHTLPFFAYYPPIRPTLAVNLMRAGLPYGVHVVPCSHRPMQAVVGSFPLLIPIFSALAQYVKDHYQPHFPTLARVPIPVLAVNSVKVRGIF